MRPYRLECLSLEGRPAFPFINAAYLITMEGSKRRPAYVHTLRTAVPLSTVNVVHNRGFRNAHKPGVTNSMEDLWHANRMIFSLCVHTMREDMYVLVMEDDVVFDDDLRAAAPRVREVLARRPGTLFLGGSPLISIAAGRHCLRTWLFGETHAVVYSVAAMRRLLVSSLPRGIPHDLFVSYKERSYAMACPVAVQPHPTTENMAQWDYTGIFRWYVRTIGAPDPWRMAWWNHAFGAYGGVYIVYVCTIVVVLATALTCARKAHAT